MIGNCDNCDRQNVPVSQGQVCGMESTQCFICQGETGPDPYGELCALESTDTERNWLVLRNELDRTKAERDSWEAQFHSAAAAASEYSEFWEKHHGDFDQFGNYIPHSQIDGDLRAAKRRIADEPDCICARS